MKKNILFLIFISIFFIIYGEEKQNNELKFNLQDFYENPFENRKKIPLWFNTYEDLIAFFSGYELKENEIPNKYTKKMDKELVIQNSDVLFGYYYRAYDGKAFKRTTFIKEVSNLKYNFNSNMTKSDVIKICGEKYILSEKNQNYDLHYNLEEGGTVHFLIGGGGSLRDKILC